MPTRLFTRAYECYCCRQVVDLYFEDSGSKLEKLDAQLASPTQPDYNAVDQLVRSGHGQGAASPQSGGVYAYTDATEHGRLHHFDASSVVDDP